MNSPWGPKLVLRFDDELEETAEPADNWRSAASMPYGVAKSQGGLSCDTSKQEHQVLHGTDDSLPSLEYNT